MADEREDRSGSGQEGVVESTLRGATTTGTSEDPGPPEEPQAAAMPRRGAGPDEDEDAGDTAR